METLRRYVQEVNLTSTLGADEGSVIRQMILDSIHQEEFILLKVLVDCCTHSLFSKTTGRSLLDTIRSDQICVTIIREFLTIACNSTFRRIRDTYLMPLSNQDYGLSSVWFTREFPMLVPTMVRQYLRHVIQRYYKHDEERLGERAVVTLFVFRVVIPYVQLNNSLPRQYREFVSKTVLNKELICETTRDLERYNKFCGSLLGDDNLVRWNNLEVSKHFKSERRAMESPKRLRKASTFY